MNRTRGAQPPATPGLPGIAPVFTEGDARPIVSAVAAQSTLPRETRLTVRPTHGQIATSPCAWSATMVFSDPSDPSDPSAAMVPTAEATGRWDIWALEALLTSVHTLHGHELITLHEATIARKHVWAEIKRLEAVWNCELQIVQTPEGA